MIYIGLFVFNVKVSRRYTEDFAITVWCRVFNERGIKKFFLFFNVDYGC